MDKPDKLNKVIEVLSLISSEKRQSTVRNIVLYILHAINEECSISDINQFIDSEFGITFVVDELADGLKGLEEEGLVKKMNSKFQISSNTSDEIEGARLIAKEKRQRLFVDFISQIDKFGGLGLSADRKEMLFNAFQEYICECIYLFGRESINLFRKNSADIRDKRNIVLKNVIAKYLQKNERDVINSFIKHFPENLTITQVELINELTEKSEEFYSLGLSSEQVEELKSANFLDWMFFLDTNVLYSVLDLHVHPENEACTKILQILKEYPGVFHLKFSYLQKTHDELKKKRQIFEQNIPKTVYNESQIRAMLNSNKLDSFTERYLEKMLIHGVNTPHPVESIDKHIAILKSKGIEINRKDLSGIDVNSEAFVQYISDYKKVESILNDARYEKAQVAKPPKDLDKIEHDVFLREAIIRFRMLKPASLSECKYFGLTIDGYLIKYDNHQLRAGARQSETSDILFPTFFRPSFLLSKLLKFLPVKTIDYKKAFVKSLLALSISDGKRNKSGAILRTVSRFKAMGLEDESIILDCITDDIFLKKAEESDSGADGADKLDLLLNEKIDKKIKIVEVENNDLKVRIETMQSVHEKVVSNKVVLEEEVKNLGIKYSQSNDDLRVYRTELEKIKIRKEIPKKKEESHAVQLDISQQIDGAEDKTQGVSAAPILKDLAQEKIINWKLLKTKFYKPFQIIEKVLYVINIFFALVFVVLACISFDDAKTFVIYAGIEGLVLALFKRKNATLTIKVTGQALVMILVAICILANRDKIIAACIAFRSSFF